jgi:hypothetical protein
MPDLGWWLENFKESAFRLERLPRYNMPEEAEMLATSSGARKSSCQKITRGHHW